MTKRKKILLLIFGIPLTFVILLLLFVSVFFLKNGLISRITHQSVTLSPDLKFNVGFQIRSISYKLPDGSSKPLTYALWYPTHAAPKTYSYNRKLLPSGLVALNAPILKPEAASAYPLVVLSHGAGGCGSIYSYITSYLASEGYVVAAPDHEDAGVFCSINNEAGLGSIKCNRSGGINDLCSRPTDISAVITDLLSQNSDPNSGLFQSIDSTKIAAIGHSAGGLTVMQLSGLKPSVTDKRIKAAVFMAADTGLYPPSAYNQIKIPALFEIGQLDTKAHSAKDTPRQLPFLNTSAPKYLFEYSGDWHLAFDDTACIGYQTIEDCQRKNPKLQPILKDTLAFLNLYLKGQNGQSVLTQETSPSSSIIVCHRFQLLNQALTGSPCPD